MWLDFLFAHNPSFAALFTEDQMSRNESALEALPEDENVADQLKTTFEEEEEEEEEGGGNSNVPGNDGSGGDAPGDSGGDAPEDIHHMDEPRNAGPEQGSGGNLYVDDVEQLGVTRSNTAVRETQEEMIRDALKDHANAEEADGDGRNSEAGADGGPGAGDGDGDGDGDDDEDGSIPWPKQGSEPVNEWTTPFLMSLCFPTLFPFGSGDVTNPDRHHEMSFSKAVTHYEKYCIERDGKFEWPLQDHPRWPHWARNVEERWRAVTQRSIYSNLRICHGKSSSDFSEAALSKSIISG